MLGQRGGANDIQEQDADLLQDLGGFRGVGPRGPAAYSVGPHRAERSIDHRVGQQGALGLEGSNTRCELVLFRGHGRRE